MEPLVFNLAPGLEPVVFILQSADCEVRFEQPESSILLEIAPSLFIKDEDDQTDFLGYYNLAKG